MKNLIRKILKESELGWMESVPSDYNLELYNFLNQEFKLKKHEFLGAFSGEMIRYKTLSGMDETFNLNFQSKKEILNKIYWLVVEDFLEKGLNNGIIRKTIRTFLNEKYN
jgi:hypothetical protein